MAETLSTLSVIAFIVAAVCLVIAVFLWFFFKIPVVIGDLTGRTARKSIAKMRATNEKTGIKTYSPSKTNVERGKVTVTVSDLVTAPPMPSPQTSMASPITQVPMTSANSVSKARSASKALIKTIEMPETALLTDNLQQEVMSETTGLLSSEETGRLTIDDADGTQETGLLQYTLRTDGKKLKMLQEVILVHTNEVIE